MAKKAELFVKSCATCQKNAGKSKDQRHTLTDVQVGHPGQTWAIDLVGPLERAGDGYRHILTARDVFTRWVEAIPLKETNAESIASALEDNVFCRHGIPEGIHSDNGHNISGTVIAAICEVLLQNMALNV